MRFSFHAFLMPLMFFFIIQGEPQLDLTVSIQEGAGLFAELHKVLQSIIHYEDQLVNVHVDWSDEFFPYKDSPDENGWDLFYKPIEAPQKRDFSRFVEKIMIDSTSVHHELHDQSCTAPWITYDQYLPYRQFVLEKLQKYIHLKDHVTYKLEEFYRSRMRNHICIGVHARIAKAHAYLVPGRHLPSLNDYYQEIDKLLAKHTDDSVIIFVASDSHQAVGQFKERYGDRVVYIDAYRSPVDQDPCILYTNGQYYKSHKDDWHKKKHRSFGGLSTILDCMLLSKCDYLIHTTSNLAFFATYYHPTIKSIYLPKGVPLKRCTCLNNPTIKNQFLNPK